MTIGMTPISEDIGRHHALHDAVCAKVAFPVEDSGGESEAKC